MHLDTATGFYRHHDGPRRWNVDNESCNALNSPNSTPAAISVIVPTVGKRSKNLWGLALMLLNSSAMSHEASELRISHASSASFEARNEMSAWLQKYGERSSSLSRRLVHVDERTMDARIGVASRFFTALSARNEIIVQMDDDIMAYASTAQLVGLLSCSVQHELALGLPPGLHGPTTRYCGPRGYGKPIMDSPRNVQRNVVLTNMAAMARGLVNRVAPRLLDLAPLLARTHGNGEDLVFANAVRLLGGRFVETDGHFRTTSAADGSFVTRPGHYKQRMAICECLALISEGESRHSGVHVNRREGHIDKSVDKSVEADAEREIGYTLLRCLNNSMTIHG
jgi:hypothetical protein|eukprot:jgi/Chrpa1/13454/Chrysochromulina_OHIO_Genome00011743-RA